MKDLKPHFDARKNLTESFYGDINTVAEIVAFHISGLINMIIINDFSDERRQLYFEHSSLITLNQQLGNSIRNHEFDYLDNIILDFFHSFHSHLNGVDKYYIKYPQENIDKLVTICNSFKGKKWDDICSDFFDALYEFLMSGDIEEIRIDGIK